MRVIGLALLPLALTFATPAMASDLIEDSCDAVTDGDANGCLYSGNINSNSDATNVNSHKFAEAEYNEWATNTANPLITLNWITASDAGNFGDFGSITGDGGTSGTFNLPGWDVLYFAVKAGDGFVLYENVGGGSTGTWATGVQQGVSHIAFFGDPGTSVPEPGTWAMMLMGFGAAGYQMRRTRRRRGEVLQTA